MLQQNLTLQGLAINTRPCSCLFWLCYFVWPFWYVPCFCIIIPCAQHNRSLQALAINTLVFCCFFVCSAANLLQSNSRTYKVEMTGLVLLLLVSGLPVCAQAEPDLAGFGDQHAQHRSCGYKVCLPFVTSSRRMLCRAEVFWFYCRQGVMPRETLYTSRIAG